MSNNSIDINNTSKDLTSQTHSTEPSINILSKLNSIANENFHQIIPSIVCEICYKADNLIICEICKNGFHQKCLGTAFLPEHFICFHCKNQFTEEEMVRIWNRFYKIDESRNRENGGNGIGLSLVKAIMNNYSNKYGVKNVAGGVEFYFELNMVK